MTNKEFHEAMRFFKEAHCFPLLQRFLEYNKGFKKAAYPFNEFIKSVGLYGNIDGTEMLNAYQNYLNSHRVNVQDAYLALKGLEGQYLKTDLPDGKGYSHIIKVLPIKEVETPLLYYSSSRRHLMCIPTITAQEFQVELIDISLSKGIVGAPAHYSRTIGGNTVSLTSNINLDFIEKGSCQVMNEEEFKEDYHKVINEQLDALRNHAEKSIDVYLHPKELEDKKESLRRLQRQDSEIRYTDMWNALATFDSYSWDISRAYASTRYCL